MKPIELKSNDRAIKTIFGTVDYDPSLYYLKNNDRVIMFNIEELKHLRKLIKKELAKKRKR